MLRAAQQHDAIRYATGEQGRNTKSRPARPATSTTAAKAAFSSESKLTAALHRHALAQLDPSYATSPYDGAQGVQHFDRVTASGGVDQVSGNASSAAR